MLLVDLSAESDPDEAAETWMRAELHQVGDPTESRLFSHALLRLAPDRYGWFQRYNHLLMDAYGCSLIGRRVAKIYTALLNGDTCLPPVTRLSANYDGRSPTTAPPTSTTTTSSTGPTTSRTGPNP